jgi:hypothetical protein
MDTTFGHSYECEQLSETPGMTILHYYYPGASTQGGRDGILVRVYSHGGQPWLGTFAFGRLSSDGVSGAFTMPDPDRLCVVARGEGYIVSANAPALWEPVRSVPIMDVRPIRGQEIIVFADPWELVAYGQTGIKWRTGRLAWDGLRITEVTDRFIKGEFRELDDEAIGSFIVDLATGTHQGGIKQP